MRMKPQTGSCALVESYVVRIYRRGGVDQCMAGTVEASDGGCAQSFHDAGELWQLLAAGRADAPHGAHANDNTEPPVTGAKRHDTEGDSQ